MPAIKHQYHTLDGLRGLAALLIPMRHASQYFGDIFFAESYLAVDLFFVLSGFVIAEAYSKKLANGIGAFDFMKLRLIRLYPLYILGAFLGIFYYLTGVLRGHNDLSVDFAVISLLALFMLPSPITSNLYPTNDPSWSLFFELISNGLYAIFYSKLTTKILVILTVVFALLLCISAYCIGNLDAGFLWKDFHVGIFRVLFSFSAGLLIQRVRGRNSSFRVPSWLWLLLVLILFCINPANQYRVWYDSIVVILIFPAIAYFCTQVEPVSPVLIKCYAFLGAVSYAVYVLHAPIAKILTDGLWGFFKVDVAKSAPLSGALLLLGLVIISWGIDAIYDRPIRRKANELFYTSKNIVKLGK